MEERVPEIRFKGFEEPWEKHGFSEITYPSGVKNRGNLPLESFSITNDCGFVPQDEKFENGGTMREADKRMYYIVSPKSFAYNPARINVGSIGYQNLSKDVIVSSLYEVFKTTDDVDDSFLWYWFKSDDFNKLIEQLQEGGVRLYFYYDKLCQGQIALPSVKEQQIIGNYLKNLDNLISLQQQKLDQLKTLKKACLEKMFPKEGETVPEIRFRGFEGPWERKKLGEISKRVIVGLATSVTPYYREKGVPIFRNLNIKANFLDDSDILYLEESYASSQTGKQIHEGDVLTVHTGYIGISCVVPYKYENCLTFTTLITTTNDDILLGEFLSQYLNSELGLSAVQMVTTQGGRQNLNSNDFIKVMIPYPSIHEQELISDYLKKLDKLTSLHQHRLDKLKDLKQACLEKMFV